MVDGHRGLFFLPADLTKELDEVITNTMNKGTHRDYDSARVKHGDTRCGVGSRGRAVVKFFSIKQEQYASRIGGGLKHADLGGSANQIVYDS